MLPGMVLESWLPERSLQAYPRSRPPHMSRQFKYTAPIRQLGCRPAVLRFPSILRTTQLRNHVPAHSAHAFQASYSEQVQPDAQVRKRREAANLIGKRAEQLVVLKIPASMHTYPPPQQDERVAQAHCTFQSAR